jgi:hypothetical protein
VPGTDVYMSLQAAESAAHIRIRVRAHPHCIVVSPAENRTPRRITRIPVERITCRLGGGRLFFRCPRCLARRAVLYVADESAAVGCRGCLGLVYASQDERKIDRLWRKQDGLKGKLGRRPRGRAGKPQGMHWFSYLNICARLAVTVQKEDRLFIDSSRRLLDRIDPSWRDRLRSPCEHGAQSPS